VHLALSAGRLGLSVDLQRLPVLAAQFGFAGVEPDSGSFFAAAADERGEFLHRIRERALDWRLSALPGALGTTSNDEQFELLLLEVRRRAPVLANAGVAAFSTWLAPANDEAPFGEVLELHRRRLDRLAPVLRAHGLRLALEYVGPLTWRKRRRHEFVHSLSGARRLIEGTQHAESFGVLLDSFHWHTAHETPGDIRLLSPDEILGVDLNDAVAGRVTDEQVDLERELPGATGGIDLTGFLQALHAVGYTGPVFAEPFGKANDALPDEARAAHAHSALGRVFRRAAIDFGSACTGDGG
jgi:sugar phosphate isomerase/epimerase